MPGLLLPLPELPGLHLMLRLLRRRRRLPVLMPVRRGWGVRGSQCL